MKPEVQRAIQVIMQEIGKAEGSAMAKMREPPPHAEPDGDEAPMPEECPECAAGTCTNPEHLSDDEMGEVERM